MMSFGSDKETYGAVSERLREELKSAGLTQKALSEKTGISASSVSKIINGRYEFLRDNFWVKLSKCSEIDISYIKYGIASK